jgi:hypothetical protein
MNLKHIVTDASIGRMVQKKVTEAVSFFLSPPFFLFPSFLFPSFSLSPFITKYLYFTLLREGN